MPTKAGKPTVKRSKPKRSGAKKPIQTLDGNPVLKAIRSDGPLPVKRIAAITSYPKGHVLTILRALYAKGLIGISKGGLIQASAGPQQAAPVAPDHDPEHAKLVEENRREYIAKVRAEWEALRGAEWRDRLMDHAAVRTMATYLGARADHYAKQEAVPADVKQKASKVLAALRAFQARREADLLDAARHFKWPTTDVRALIDKASGRVEIDGSGLLTHYGYRVGLSGAPTRERRRTLDLLLASPDAQSVDPDAGPPGSCRRLRRVAYAIAFLTRNAKRQTKKDFSAAISDWTEDLEYLRVAYYRGRCDGGRFPWPST